MATVYLDEYYAIYTPCKGADPIQWDGGAGTGIPKSFSSRDECLNSLINSNIPLQSVRLLQVVKTTSDFKVYDNELAGS